MDLFTGNDLARSLFEDSGDALFLFDPADDHLIAVNPTCQRMTGWSGPEVLSRKIDWLFRSHSPLGRQQLRAACGKTQVFHSREGFFLRTKSGWLSVNLTVSRLHFRPKTLGLLTVRDVSGRTKAEEALKESEQRFRQMAENIAEVFWIVDAATLSVLYISPAFEAVWGRSRETFHGRPMAYLEGVHADDRALVGRAVDVMRAGDASYSEYRVVRPDGAIRWIKDRGFPVRDQQGRIYRFVGAAEDITPRKQVEAALRDSEALYSSLVERLPLCLFRKDGDGRYTFGNGRFLAALGRSSQEVLGRTDFDLSPPDLAAKYRQDDLRVLETRTPLEEVEEHHRPNGARYFIQVWKTPICDARGRVTGIQGMFWDVSRQRTLEEQLRQAQKMEAVGRLAGGIAHDFNNLLTIINGYSEMQLLRLSLEDPLREMARQVRKAGERAAGLTNQLLAFSRQDPPRPRVLDLNAVLVETEKMLRRLVGERCALRTVLASDLDTVKIDPGHLEQVIVNLVVNARDAMSNGDVTVETRNARRAADGPLPATGAVHAGDYVVLAVRDTGAGMDEATRARIFEPFFTTKAVGQGTGLGLSVVHGIVEQAGGFIDVFSAVGQGTTFEVNFPAVTEAADAHDSVTDFAAPPVGTETLLVVEDEPEVRTFVRLTLEAYGYSVLAAAGGAEALEVCATHAGAIDLLLSDVVMPRMSGPQLAARIRSLRPGLKVLLMSGYPDGEVGAQGILGTGVALIQKPFTPTSLVQKVRDVLDDRGALGDGAGKDASGARRGGAGRKHPPGAPAPGHPVAIGQVLD